MEEVYVVGRNPVLELLKTEKQIDKIYVLKGDLKGSIKKILGIANDKGIIIQEVDKIKLDEYSNGQVHQGVAALVTGFEYSTIEDIFEKAKQLGEEPFIVILDEIEDPHNLGAIIRTCECAGVHGVIIPKRRSARINQTVYKSSAGAVNHVLVSDVTNISKTIEVLKDKGLWIYGADLKGENYYYKESLTGAIGLVIGNEGKGISRIVSEKCDVLIKIPMFGNISSLNASTSAAILIYEVIRQNDEKRKSHRAKEYLFVDGYNIINDWENLKKKQAISLEEARDGLIETMAEYHHFSGIEIIVVFDAHFVKKNRGSEIDYKGIKIIYTKENETADHYIERTLDKVGRIKRIRVATSDWLEQQIVLSRGGTRISARELEIEIRNEMRLVNKEIKYSNKKNNNALGRLDDKLLSKLEAWNKNPK